MKRAILLHGTGGSDQDYFWFSDTKAHLMNRGYEVWWPQLPNTNKPEIKQSLKFVQDNMPTPDKDMIIIGHSSACPLILALLQELAQPIAKAILVSGFYVPLNEVVELMLLDDYDWGKIRQNAGNITLINSDNDPWGCDDKQARPVADKLNADFILMKGEGHMGSGKFNQPYDTFPLVKRLIDA